MGPEPLPCGGPPHGHLPPIARAARRKAAGDCSATRGGRPRGTRASSAKRVLQSRTLAAPAWAWRRQRRPRRSGDKRAERSP